MNRISLFGLLVVVLFACSTLEATALKAHVIKVSGKVEASRNGRSGSWSS